MTSICIFGAGGHGKVVAETAQTCGFSDIHFLDDNLAKGHMVGVWKVVGQSDKITETTFCAIGDNSIREEFFSARKISNAPILVSRFANVSQYSSIAQGTLVVAGSTINIGAQIGSGTIVNTNSSIDHDCIIGDFCHISPGANLAGNVEVGDGTWIGLGAKILPGVKIGKNVIVGAGATVISDVISDTKVVGIPAKEI